MSATLVQSDKRPVPLEFEYSTTQLQEKVAELNEQGRSPVYLVHFTQNACADTAQSCQFKHKEVIIGKLEPLMDANEREFLMSYENSQNHPVDNA